MSNIRKKYDEEFKNHLIRMSNSRERPVTAVAESLGVTSSMIYRWRKKYMPDGEKMQLAQQKDELSEFRRRTVELEEGKAIGRCPE
jgi:Transposase.